MNIHFLKRELNEGEIEWGITPLYLMAIREQNPEAWSRFVNMVNSVNDHSLDEILEKRRNDKKKEKMKKKKDETKMIIVTPKKLRLLKLGLKERTKVRRRKEQERRQQYFK